MGSKLAQVTKEMMVKNNNQSKTSNDLEGSRMSKGGGNSQKQPSNLSRSQSQSDSEKEEEEDPEVVEQRRLQEEKEYQLRRKFKQVSNALQKPLVFGLTEDLRYGNHKNPVMWFLENQNNNLFVSADEKSVHFWKMDDGKKHKVLYLTDLLKSHVTLSSIGFSHRFRLYLLVTSDFRMLFLNEMYSLVCTIDMSAIRLVSFVDFHDESSKLITAGIDGIFIFDFCYQAKYDPKHAAQIDPEGKSIGISLKNKTPIEKMVNWAKGLKIDTKNELIISWSQTRLAFNSLKTGDLIYQFKDITSMENHLTDVHVVMMPFKYFITGSFQGQLQVWKYSEKRRLIHSFDNAHIKEVSTIGVYPGVKGVSKGDDAMFMTSSTDGTVKVWSLDRFQMVYQFQLPYALTFSKLFNRSKQVAVSMKDRMLICGVHLIAEHYLSPEIPLAQLKPAYLNPTARDSSQVSLSLALCENNSIYIQNQTGVVQSTVFPPPTAQQIVSMHHSMKMNRLIVFLLSGAICYYQFDSGETALLEKIQHLNTLKDCEGKQATTSQSIRCMTVIRAERKDDWVPPLDAEVFNEQMHLNALAEILAMDAKKYLARMMVRKETASLEAQEYLVFGMSKGSVYFVNSQNLDKLYARVTVTRSAVTAISYMQHTRLYASTCEENKLTIWSLDAGKNSAGLGSARERKLTTLYQIKLFRPVRHLSYMPAKRDSVIDANISGDRFMFSFDSGEFEIFEVETYGPQVHEKRVHLVETDKSREHEASLTAIDFHKNLNFMVTACQGGQVKIWSTNNVKGLGDKQLIREINFPNKVDTVCFMNEHGDILVGHDRRLSVIKFQAYWPFRDERGKLEANAAIESRETPQEVKRIEISEPLFENMKKRDDVIRNGGQPGLPAIPKRKAMTQASSPAKKSVNFDAVVGTQEPDQPHSGAEEEEEIDLEKPPTPMTMRALQFYNSLQGSQQRRSLDLRGFGHSEPQPVTQVEHAMKKRGSSLTGKGHANKKKISEEIAIYLRQKTLHMIREKKIIEESERDIIPEQLIKALSANPASITALPPINQGPVRYAQNMLQTNTMTMMMLAAQASGTKPFPGSAPQPQKLTRRDITDQRIIQNILQYNSPIGQKDFSNLRLGPLRQKQQNQGVLTKRQQQDYLMRMQQQQQNMLAAEMHAESSFMGGFNMLAGGSMKSSPRAGAFMENLSTIQHTMPSNRKDIHSHLKEPSSFLGGPTAGQDTTGISHDISFLEQSHISARGGHAQSPDFLGAHGEYPSQHPSLDVPSTMHQHSIYHHHQPITARKPGNPATLQAGLPHQRGGGLMTDRGNPFKQHA